MGFNIQARIFRFSQNEVILSTQSKFVNYLMPPKKSKSGAKKEVQPQPEIKSSTAQVAKSRSKDKILEGPIAKDSDATWIWKQIGTCFVGSSPQLKGNAKIASFDMDDTIVHPKGGAKFAVDGKDWVFLSEKVPKKIAELAESGMKIVIFTNQMGVQNGKTKIEHLKEKVRDLARIIGVEMQVFIAISEDEYRKPSPKMWQLLEQQNEGFIIDKAASFFCGDAAGRKDGKHKDFSDSDLKFAVNVGVEFLTPQNLYDGDKTKVEVQGFNPAKIAENGELILGKTWKEIEFVPNEMVIFCGAPGSGKSTFWKNFMSKYARVNRDTLKTKEKCYKVAEEEILKGNSVIIDNTNPKKEDRKYFIDLALKHKFKIRCFLFSTPKQICFHNDYQRLVNEKREHLSSKAGSIPIHSWFKNKEDPELGEGFYEINQVNFLAKFYDDADRKAYRQFSKK